MSSISCFTPKISVLLVFATLTSSSIAEWITCDHNPMTLMNIDNDNKLFVYNAEITVRYDRSALAVYGYAESNAVNVLVNNTMVFLKGNVLKEDEPLDPNSYKLYAFHTKIAGSAQVVKSIYSDDTLTDCELYLSRSPKEDGGDLPKRLQIEVLHQAAKCIRAQICKQLGGITHEDYMNGDRHPFFFGPLKVGEQIEAPKLNLNATNITALMTSVQVKTNNVELQSAINMLVDLVISGIREKIKEDSNGLIKLPDIKENFSEETLWRPEGEFDAINGVFSDLTTLSRYGDAHLSHSGWNFTVSCGFGLSKANIHYEKYKLKYAVKVSGELSASVDGVELETAVVVDYRRKPCQVSLKDLKIVDLGKLTVRITGLGPLNKLSSKLISWITKTWKEEVITRVQGKVAEVVEDHLSQFDCEKYRP